MPLRGLAGPLPSPALPAFASPLLAPAGPCQPSLAFADSAGRCWPSVSIFRFEPFENRMCRSGYSPGNTYFHTEGLWCQSIELFYLSAPLLSTSPPKRKLIYKRCR